MFVGNKNVGHLRTSVGRPVEGEQFFNRQDEVARFIEILDEGDNISLIAPRRVGKTSLMREVSRQLKDRYVCLHLDLEACRSPADFFSIFAREAAAHVGLQGRLRDLFDGLVQGVHELKAEGLSLEVQKLFATSWKDRGDRLFRRLSEQPQATVLFLDEVPIFIHRLLTDERRCIEASGVQRADEFLSWLRALALRHADELRLVVTGSIGLTPVLRRAGLSATMNAYRSFELHPWDQATTRTCLQALARNYGLSYAADADLAIFERLGAGIPHHVQMFFDHLRQHLRRQRVQAAFPKDIDHVYDTHMLSSRGHPELSHYEERLALVHDPVDLPLAMDLLTEASLGRLTREVAELLAQEHRHETAAPQRLDMILEILIHDGYLLLEQDAWIFESRLVRDWWSSRHKNTYRSPAQKSR